MENMTSMQTKDIILRNKRIDYLDVFKGIAIILVVLGHACNSTEIILNRFILSFHMPAFFFCSGILFRPTGGMIEFFKKKVYSLLIPMLVLGGINVTLESALSLFNLAFSRLDKPITEFFNWFLLTLFLVESSCFLLLFKVKKTRIQYRAFGILGISLGAFLLTNYNGIYVMQQVFAATVFFMLGFLLRPYLTWGGTAYQAAERFCWQVV